MVKRGIKLYVSKIRIQNFRCFNDVTIEFNQGLNVIIGENNSGKTAILEAMKLVFDRSNSEKPTFDDFYKNIPSRTPINLPRLLISKSLYTNTIII